jgi:hypothetical protein
MRCAVASDDVVAQSRVQRRVARLRERIPRHRVHAFPVIDVCRRRGVEHILRLVVGEDLNAQRLPNRRHPPDRFVDHAKVVLPERRLQIVPE